MTKKTIKKNSSRLAKTYYNPSDTAGYAGASKLKSMHPTLDAETWLSNQPTYSLHKYMRRRFQTRKYKTSAPNELWQMDLMEMIPYANINKGYKYILTCIDVFTRIARAEPLKAKDAVHVSEAIENMFKKSKDKPRSIQTDLGKEFYNKSVSQLFKKNNIRHYSVHSQFKAALVERFNRTLREKLNRFFTHHGNKVWYSVLPELIKTYNNTPHRGLNGKRPIDIDHSLSHWLSQENVHVKNIPKTAYPLKSLVRISRISANPFRKNFDQNWSEEIFRIAAIDTRDKPVMYVLKDLKGEILQGKFYHQELQVVGNDLPKVYRVERVISTRGKGRHKQYLVKWHGYDDSHNSWITHNQFVNKI